MLLHRYLGTLFVLISLPLAAAISIGQQFNLKPGVSASSGSPTRQPLRHIPDPLPSGCFLTCHTMATNSVLLPGRDINFVTAIGKNCAFDVGSRSRLMASSKQSQEWAVMVSACLPYTCVSAPDLGYAIEYGHSFCARAGYHKVNLTLPQWFLDSEGGAWYK
jgi:hypothetical protein